VADAPLSPEARIAAPSAKAIVAAIALAPDAMPDQTTMAEILSAAYAVDFPAPSSPGAAAGEPTRRTFTALTQRFLAEKDTNMRQFGDGVVLIAAERQRQVTEEGWTVGHDDVHGGEELAQAAACYALPPDVRDGPIHDFDLWPFQPDWWKPGDRVRELVKAGALIAAEIDRLQRAALRSAAPVAAPTEPSYAAAEAYFRATMAEHLGPDEDIGDWGRNQVAHLKRRLAIAYAVDFGRAAVAAPGAGEAERTVRSWLNRSVQMEDELRDGEGSGYEHYAALRDALIVEMTDALIGRLQGGAGA
jgi:hypothetical protein